MALAQSKVTSQGQTSVPLEVRRKLGIGPGSVLEWEEVGEKVFVKKAGRNTSLEINRVLFPGGPPVRRTTKDLKNGLRQEIQKRDARR